MFKIFFYRHTALKWAQENPYDRYRPVNLKILHMYVPFSSRYTAWGSSQPVVLVMHHAPCPFQNLQHLYFAPKTARYVHYIFKYDSRPPSAWPPSVS